MPARSDRDTRRRALGQNFLIDERAIAAVVGTLHPPPGSTVVDLGAGAGALAVPVARRGAHVVAVEWDVDWVRRLRARAPEWGSVEVVRADVLTVAFPSTPYLVVASPPYGIATAPVRRLLTEAHGLVRATLVLQLETARRLAGRPRCGRVAATWAPWCSLAVEAPQAFRPVPAVASAILTLAPRATPLLSPAAYAAYDPFLARLFGGRGRTVADRLGGALGRRAARAACAAVGIAPAATPSAVAPEAYAALFTASRVRR